MSSVDDQPSLEAMGVNSPEVLWTLTDDERKAILTRICKTTVQKFINFSFNSADNDQHNDNDQCNDDDQPNDDDQSNDDDQPNEVQDHTDEVHRYACLLLSIGCFYLAYKDSIKEGDSKSVLECWRYLIPAFHNAN